MECRECPYLGRHKTGALICTFFMPAYETNLDQDCFVAEVGGDYTFLKTIYDELLEQESQEENF